MKKKIFIPFLLLPVFLFQNCIQKIAGSLSEPVNNEVKYIFSELDTEKWIEVSPKKKVYKVGDTVSITYKIPSKIGKYAEVSFDTKQNIKRLLKKDYKDFDIYKDAKQGNLVSFGFHKILCKSNPPNCKLPKNKKGLIAILNGKKVDYGKYPVNDYINYTYNPQKKEYTISLKLIFLKPNIFYWKTLFSVVSDSEALSLIPVVNTKLVNVKNEYEYNDLIIKYTESKKTAFKVVE